MSNETLAFWRQVQEIERRPQRKAKVKALCKEKQDLFTYLCNLHGDDLKQALKEWRNERD